MIRVTYLCLSMVAASASLLGTANPVRASSRPGCDYKTVKIVATDYPDCHSPSLAGYTTGRAVDGVPRAGRLGPPTPAGRTGRIPMPRPHNPQRPPAR